MNAEKNKYVSYVVVVAGSILRKDLNLKWLTGTTNVLTNYH